jgi:hypothetical protein
VRKSQEFFICQQGFAVPNANPHLYSALMLQPRIIGGLVVLGSMLQRPELFLLLSAVLVAFPRGFPPLDAAPAPRRFAQGSAAMLALAIGMALVTGATMMAWILEGIFVAAVVSVVLRRFCLPAHLYHVLRRQPTLSECPSSSISQRSPLKSPSTRMI